MESLYSLNFKLCNMDILLDGDNIHCDRECEKSKFGGDGGSCFG